MIRVIAFDVNETLLDLRVIAARGAMRISRAQADQIVDTTRRLPGHPDAAPALDRLRAAGRTLITLTNSPLEVVEAQPTRKVSAPTSRGMTSSRWPRTSSGRTGSARASRPLGCDTLPVVVLGGELAVPCTRNPL